jgi:DNA-damage-inducible protein J
MTIGPKNDDVVRARIDFATKQEATAILSEIGLTPSDAFRMLLRRTVAEGALPFDPLVPSDETLAAIAEHREEKLPTFSSMRALRANMHART